jgi:hypothetical protein
MIAGSRRGAVLACSSLLFSMLAASPACSSKSPTQFASAGDDGGTADGGDDGSGNSSGGGGTSSGGLSLEGGGSSGGMGTGTCKDGTYTGTFQCTFVFGDGGAPDAGADAGGLVVTGTISFHLMQQTGTGETFMDTASGMFSGDCCMKLFTISANVGGTLNCNSGTFKGDLTGGMYSGFIFIAGTFMGPLTADYNGTTASFVNGAWNLTVPGQGTCPGTWTASYSGP